jgi:cytochrome b pre-mRNA-processing protein 3
MSLGLFRNSAKTEERAAQRLYAAAVAQAREPGFYTAFKVPDTLDGRFELLSLHVYLLLRRLKREGEAGAAVGRALVDLMFANMDESLREMGAGDLGVGKRVKRMASAFYGRLAAYEAGLAGTPAALQAAIGRNLFGTVDSGPEERQSMARYLQESVARLDRQPAAALLAGEVCFEPPSSVAAGAAPA